MTFLQGTGYPTAEGRKKRLPRLPGRECVRRREERGNIISRKRLQISPIGEGRTYIAINDANLQDGA